MSNTGTMKKKGSCPLCVAINDRWMIQCDNRRCDGWFHLRCVGLTQKEAEIQSWYCYPCTKAMNSNSKVTVDSLLDFDQQLSSTRVPHDENVTVIQKKGINLSNPFCQDTSLSSALNELTLIPTNCQKSHDPPMQKLRNSGSNKSMSSSHSKSLTQQKLELHKRKEELVVKERELIEQQLTLLDEMQEESDSEEEISTRYDSSPRRHQQSVSNVKQPRIRESSPPPYNSLNRLSSHENVTKSVSPQERFTSNNPFDQAVNPEDLNVRHWSARHVLPKSLPIFSGRSEEWVTFISAYEHANSAGGYSDVENLPRLEASIRGAAREFVKSLFTSANNVPLIMNTLKRMFGRPEQLMKVHLEEIRKMRRPDPNRPETVLFFAASVQNLWSTMKASNMSAYLNNPNMMQELIEMLPESLKWEWSDKLRMTSNDIESFTTWLDDVSDRICTVNPSLDLTKAFENRNTKRKEQINANVVKRIHNCIVCDGDCSTVDVCETFLKQNVEQRWQVIKTKGLCRKCLRKHVLKPPYRCAAERKCDVNDCPGGHHPLVHRELPVVFNHHVVNEEDVRFRYVPIKLVNGNKESYEWAFMDSGSSGTFIDKDLALELGLNGPISNLCIKHTSDRKYFEQESMRVTVMISGTYKNAHKYTLSGVQTMTNLGLEEQTLKYDAIADKFLHLRNLPVESYVKAKPRILIGLNNWHLAVPTRVRTGIETGPIAARCKLGWTIYASVADIEDQSINHCHHVLTTMNIKTSQSDGELHKAMRDFFSLESLGVSPPPDEETSMEHRLAYEILKDTTRMVEGRVETGLLWKSKSIKLPDSVPVAMRRLKCLEYRMKRDPQLEEAAREQMKRYRYLG